MALPMASFINPTVAPTASQPASIDQFARAQEAGYRTGQSLGGNLENAVKGYTEGRQTAQTNTINQQTIEANEQLKIQREIQMETQRLNQEAARLQLEKTTKEMNDANLQKAQDLERMNKLSRAQTEAAKLERDAKIAGKQSAIDAILNDPAADKSKILDPSFSDYWAANPQQLAIALKSPEIWTGLSTEQKRAWSGKKLTSMDTPGGASDQYDKARSFAMKDANVKLAYNKALAANPGISPSVFIAGYTYEPVIDETKIAGAETAPSNYRVFFKGKEWGVLPKSSIDALNAAQQMGLAGEMTQDDVIAQGGVGIDGAPTSSTSSSVTTKDVVSGPPAPISRARQYGIDARRMAGDMPLPIVGISPNAISRGVSQLGDIAGVAADFGKGLLGIEDAPAADNAAVDLIAKKQAEIEAKLAAKAPGSTGGVYSRMVEGASPVAEQGSGGGVEGGGNIPAPIRAERPSVNPISSVPENIRRHADTKGAEAVTKNKELKDLPALVKALAVTESRGGLLNRSKTGVEGPLQVTRATTREMGFDPDKPEDDAKAGAKYIALQLKRFGTIPLAAVAYNAGPGVAARARALAGSTDWPSIKSALQYMVQQGELSKEKYNEELATYPDRLIANLHLFVDPKDPILTLV
jgi:hypothetical protein